jgi:hypothetical protein
VKIRLQHITLDDLDVCATPVFLLQLLGKSAIDLYRDEPTASFNEDVGQ